MINHASCTNKTSTSRIPNDGTGDRISLGVIGVLFLTRLLYGAIQTNLGRGYGNFFQRFLQNTMACLSIGPEEDVEKAAELGGADVSDSNSMSLRKMSIQSMSMSKMEDAEKGVGMND